MTDSEAHLLARIYERSRDMPDFVETGPGDDCAVLRLESGIVLISVDQCIEGRHFAKGEDSVERIASIALRRAISDIHAMGGRATSALAAGAIGPSAPAADMLFEALAEESKSLGIALVGGDIASTDGPTMLSITILGEPHAERGSVLRSGARAGDGVFVTGPLGTSAAGGWTTPIPVRAAEAAWLCDALGEDLHAMIDLSDGLGIDGGRIAEASGVRLLLEEAAIPLGQGATITNAVGGGNDYELLCTASAGAILPDAGIELHRIGRVVEGEGCAIVMADGTERDIGKSGWDHRLP